MKETTINNIRSICTYVMNTEQEDYNNSFNKEDHVYELARQVLNDI